MTVPIKLFTIGFTKKSAARFFGKLRAAGVARVLDTRLNNNSQLAGFAKKDDLAFFLDAVAGIGYAHLTELAPTADILDAYKKNDGDWAVYEPKYLALLAARRVEDTLDRALFDGGCLLCSEHEPDRCHRRLAAEYLREKWGGVEIVHLT